MSSDQPAITGTQMVKLVQDRRAFPTEEMIIALALRSVRCFELESMRAKIIRSIAAVVISDGNGFRPWRAVAYLDLEMLCAAINRHTFAVIPINLDRDQLDAMVKFGAERGLVLTDDQATLERGMDAIAELLATWPEVTLTSFWARG